MISKGFTWGNFLGKLVIRLLLPCMMASTTQISLNILWLSSSIDPWPPVMALPELAAGTEKNVLLIQSKFETNS